MLSDGSFEKVEDVVMITDDDIQMATKVAETHKNEEDETVLALSGEKTEEFTFLRWMCRSHWLNLRKPCPNSPLRTLRCPCGQCPTPASSQQPWGGERR